MKSIEFLPRPEHAPVSPSLPLRQIVAHCAFVGASVWAALVVPACSAGELDVPPVQVSAESVATTEGGGSQDLVLSLASQPQSDVSVFFMSGDTSEALPTPDTVIFTRDNWEEERTVRVTGVDDDEADGDITFALRWSSASEDTNFVVPTNEIRVTNRDDDEVGVVMRVAGATATHEIGTTADVELVLTSRPLSTVDIVLRSSDETEGKLSTTSVKIAPAEWNAGQTVTVSGMADDALDGESAYQIEVVSVASSDPLYEGLESPPVDLTNRDLVIEPIAKDMARSDTVFTRISPDGGFALGIVAPPLEDGPRVDVVVFDRKTGESFSPTRDNPLVGEDGLYREAALSAQATHVAFLVGHPSVAEIFLYTHATGELRQLDLGPSGEAPNGAAASPSISSDGRYVAFESEASNLVASDTNGVSDVFLFDTSSGVLRRISHPAWGYLMNADGASHAPSVSGDGRYVAFHSFATNIDLPNDDGQERVYRYNIDGKDQRRVALMLVPAKGDGATAARNPSISHDGRYIAFEYDTTRDFLGTRWDHTGVLVYDVDEFVWDVVTDATHGDGPDDESRQPRISGDGRFVTYRSRATDLIEVDKNGFEDVYVYDRVRKLNRRVSITRGRLEGDGHGMEPDISFDGKDVVFISTAPNFGVPSDGAIDAFAVRVDDAFWAVPSR
jgi:Tol biopolymer transport system component